MKKPPSMDVALAGKLLQSLAMCSTLPCSAFTVEAMHPDKGVNPLTVLVLTEPVWGEVKAHLNSLGIEFP